MIRIRNHSKARAGFTLVEVCIAGLLLSVIVLGMTMALQMESRSMRVYAELTNAELRSQEMLDRLERMLSYAHGEAVEAFLTEDLAQGALMGLKLDSTTGFPDEGELILSAGTLDEEVVRYSTLSPLSSELDELERGVQCSDESSHAAGARVLWAPMARPIGNQTNPAPNLYDGISQELFGTFFYEGNGSGFSFRVPVDPTGSGTYVDEGQIRLGAMLQDGDDVAGWSAVYFAPTAKITEASRNVDINRDGDREDTFDLGSLRVRSWRTTDAAEGQTRDVGLCPPIILQEECAWGGDLDGDGFSDPIFLYDERTQRLRIRLHVLTGTVGQIGVVKRKELALLLRNSNTN